MSLHNKNKKNGKRREVTGNANDFFIDDGNGNGATVSSHLLNITHLEDDQDHQTGKCKLEVIRNCVINIRA